MAYMAGEGQAELWSQAILPGLPSQPHQQGARSGVELLGLKPVPLWDGIITMALSPLCHSLLQHHGQIRITYYRVFQNVAFSHWL